MTSKRVVTGMKVKQVIWMYLDFGCVAPFKVNDERTFSDENVVNAITCDFPCKIFKSFTLHL